MAQPDTRTIKNIEFGATVGLRGCRYGADVRTMLDGKVPKDGPRGAIANVKAISKALDEKCESCGGTGWVGGEKSGSVTVPCHCRTGDVSS